jgi:hypothetical protein
MNREPENPTGIEKDWLTLKPAWRSFFVYYTAMVIFGLGPAINPEAGVDQTFGLVLALLSGLFVLFRGMTTFYRVTPREILRETRFAGRVFKKSLPLEKVAGVTVRRGAVHRLLGIGHLQIQSRPQVGSDLWWYGLADPFTVKEKLDRFLR